VSVSARKCLVCGGSESIGADELVWPLNWRCSRCGHSIPQDRGISMFAPELADTVTGFDPADFQFLAKVEDEHFWFVARNQLIVGLINKFFPDARRFLEIGCGNGAVLKAVSLSRRWERVVGSELHTAGLVYARQRLATDIELVQMDARSVPATDAFDLTGAFDVIEHIPDDEAVLRGLRAATEKGGGIILSVPQHPWLWSSADDRAHHQRRYRRGELEEKLLRNGFEILFSSSFTALLLPLMVMSRLTARSSGQAQERVDREFSVSPLLNRLLTGVLRAEVFATLNGMVWPAGGSRIVVGRAV
jgi:SAM-dependent methyltransferase